jgi:hypothetical protein
MPIDTSMAGALASLSGANNQLAPNPMGGFFAGALMNQEQGNNALNQEGQQQANTAQEIANTQNASKTDAIAAQAALAAKQAKTGSDVWDQTGHDQMVAETKAAISKATADMSTADLLAFNNKLHYAEHAGKFAQAYGDNGKGIDDPDNTQQKQRERAAKFVAANPHALKLINNQLQSSGMDPIDLNEPNPLGHIFAASDAASSSLAAQHEIAVQRVKNAGALDVEHYKGETAISVALIEGGNNITKAILAAPPLQGARMTLARNAGNRDYITPEEYKTLIEASKASVDQSLSAKDLERVKESRANALKSSDVDELRAVAKKNEIDISNLTDAQLKKTNVRVDIAEAIAKKEFDIGYKKLLHDTAVAAWPPAANVHALTEKDANTPTSGAPNAMNMPSPAAKAAASAGQAPAQAPAPGAAERAQAAAIAPGQVMTKTLRDGTKVQVREIAPGPDGKRRFAPVQ